MVLIMPCIPSKGNITLAMPPATKLMNKLRNIQIEILESAAVAECLHTTENTIDNASQKHMYTLEIVKNTSILITSSTLGGIPIIISPVPLTNAPSEKTINEIAVAPAENLALIIESLYIGCDASLIKVPCERSLFIASNPKVIPINGPRKAMKVAKEYMLLPLVEKSLIKINSLFVKFPSDNCDTAEARLAAVTTKNSANIPQNLLLFRWSVNSFLYKALNPVLLCLFNFVKDFMLFCIDFGAIGFVFIVSLLFKIFPVYFFKISTKLF